MWSSLRQIFADQPPLVRAAAILYFVHIFFQPKVAASQISLALAVICALAAMNRGQLRLAESALYGPILVFLTASFASAILAPDPVQSLRDLGDPLTFSALPLALSLYRHDRRLLQTGLGVVLMSGVVQGAYGIFQYFAFDGGQLEHRIKGAATHVMTYSGIMLPIALLALILAIELPRWTHIGAAAVTLTALALTFTRSAWLGCIAGAFAILALRRPRWLIVLVPAGLLAFTFSPMPFFSRLVSAFDPQKSSNLDRVRMVQAGIEMIGDHPLFGVGPSNVKDVYPLYRLPDAPRFKIPHLHNNIVMIWAERGVIALFGYLSILAAGVYELLKGFRREGMAATFALAGIASIVALTLAGVFEYNFGDSEVLNNMLDVLAVTIAMSWQGGSAET